MHKTTNINANILKLKEIQYTTTYGSSNINMHLNFKINSLLIVLSIFLYDMSSTLSYSQHFAFTKDLLKFPFWIMDCLTRGLSQIFLSESKFRLLNMQMTIKLLYIPAQIIQMIAFTRIMVIWTPAILLQDYKPLLEPTMHDDGSLQS